jgi:hypothetical protein
MEDIKDPLIYKGVSFEIRPNRFGTSRLLFPLAGKLNEAMQEAVKDIIITPEYVRYSAIMDEYEQINNSLENTKLLEPNGEAETKLKEETLTKTEYDLQQVRLRLNEPVLRAIQELYLYRIGSARLTFINDPANVKIMCEALLIGDVSVIDFENPDEEYWALTDKVRDFFLITEQQIKTLLKGY